MPTTTEPSSILRLRLRLHCDQAQARPLQQRASRMFHCRLYLQLQALFAHLASQLGTRTLALDKLVLDLGAIAVDDFDSQFGPRLLAQLEQRLTDLIASLPSGRQRPAGTLAVPRRQADERVAPTARILPWTTPAASPAPGAGELAAAWPVMDRHGTPVAAVLAYLQDGYWPWPAGWRAGAGAWLRVQIDAGAADWTPVLVLCCRRPESLRRLRGTFDLAAQSALQQAAHPQWAPVEAQQAECWQRWRAAVQGGADRLDLRAPVRTGVPFDAPPASVAASLPWAASPGVAGAGTLPTLSKMPTVPSAPALSSAPVRARLPSDPPPAATHAGASSSVPPLRAMPGAVGSTFDAPVPIAVSNAGLVLLWPMLARLFNQLQLLHEADFIDDDARARAVCLLDWLLWDDGGADGAPPAAVDPELEPEWRTPLTKLLCGWPLTQALPGWHRPDAGQQQLLRTWMPTSLGLWPAMQRIGTTWARELFLRREGQVLCSPERIELVVTRDASDVLLHDLPWPLQEIDLPWMPKPLLVDWGDPGSDWRDLSAGSHPA